MRVKTDKGTIYLVLNRSKQPAYFKDDDGDFPPSFEISWKQVEGKWDSDCFSKHKLTLLETRTQAMPKIVVEVVVEIRHITSGFVEHSRIFSPQFFETKAWNISAKLRISPQQSAL